MEFCDIGSVRDLIETTNKTLREEVGVSFLYFSLLTVISANTIHPDGVH